MKTSYLAGLATGVAVCLLAPLWAGSAAAQVSPDNAELTKIVQADQQDRAGVGKPIDWTVVGPRDQARLKRVKEIYMAKQLVTAQDYANAALVLQHSAAPDDFLLAHDLCVVSILKGNRDARWLAAAAEDRFLMNINRPQRFGTQYRSTSRSQPITLYPVDASVTDALRAEMGAPTLAEAKAREKEMQQMFPPAKSGGG